MSRHFSSSPFLTTSAAANIMARNQNTRNSEGVCKKIRNAFSITPFKSKIHRVSHHSSSSSSHRPIPQPQMIKHSTDRPVPDDHAVRRDILILNGDHNAQKTKSSTDDDGKMKKKVAESKSNEKFSDYIMKVKDKIRTSSSLSLSTSNVGAAARTTTRRDSFNDKVMNYINRAKLKIRTTTSVGDDNGVSFK